ncbi:unnamed protein product [Rhodiola kirilowii]
MGRRHLHYVLVSVVKFNTCAHHMFDGMPSWIWLRGGHKLLPRILGLGFMMKEPWTKSSEVLIRNLLSATEVIYRFHTII